MNLLYMNLLWTMVSPMSGDVENSPKARNFQRGILDIASERYNSLTR